MRSLSVLAFGFSSSWRMVGYPDITAFFGDYFRIGDNPGITSFLDPAAFIVTYPENRCKLTLDA